MNKAQKGAVVAAVGGLLILLSALLQTWWAEDNGSIGLTKLTASAGGQSVSVSLSDSEKEKGWTTTGQITYWLSIVAFVVLAAGALRLLGVALPEQAPLAGAVLAGLALLGGLLFFLVLKPSDMDVSMGWGFPVFVIGAAAGIVGSLQQKAAAQG